MKKDISSAPTYYDPRHRRDTIIGNKHQLLV